MSQKKVKGTRKGALSLAFLPRTGLPSKDWPSSKINSPTIYRGSAEVFTKC